MKGSEPVSESSAAEIVAAVLAGNRQAFAPLVEQHQTAIYNFVYRYTRSRADAEDLTQETFLRAFRHLHQYRGHLPFRNWLYGIAVHACRDWSRRRSVRPLPAANLPEEIEKNFSSPADIDPSEQLHAAENRRQLEKAVQVLPDGYKTVFILFYIQEVSQAEIARALRLPLTVVKNRLYRARLMLRKSLAASGVEL